MGDKIKGARIQFREELFENKARVTISPTVQFADSFFVAREMFEYNGFELQPLTLGRFIKSVIYNSTIEWRWLIMRSLWKRGFIDPPEGSQVIWSKHWHWDSVRVLERRAALHGK